MKFPTTQIANLTVSRMICGTNPFFGFSHFSAARDDWLREHFTDERILQVMQKCDEFGINAVISSPNERMPGLLKALADRTGRRWIWLCTPSGTDAAVVAEGIRWCAAHEAEICLPHTSYTDSHLVPCEDRIAGLKELTALIRDLGMIPGLSTHRPEALTVSERAGYDIEVYLQPLNPIGFLCPVETDWTARVIRSTPKPVVAIKPLGAGRVMPPTGLPFVYSSIKENDAVAVGFMSAREVEEDVAIALEALQGSHADIPLQRTRSKDVLDGGR
jgi:hypothetical protein